MILVAAHCDSVAGAIGCSSTIRPRTREPRSGAERREWYGNWVAMRKNQISDIDVRVRAFPAAPLGNLCPGIDEDIASDTMSATWTSKMRYFDAQAHLGLEANDELRTAHFLKVDEIAHAATEELEQAGSNARVCVVFARQQTLPSVIAAAAAL
jgi:hypothetical protein